MKVLIVDDDPNTLAQLSRAFRMEGQEAVVADSAAKALERLREDQPDAVVSDVVMPGTSGLELLESIRQVRPDVPVVMISGQASIEMAVRATRSGALDFLEKPVSAQKLLVTVENAVRLRRLEDENRELRKLAGDGDLVFTSLAMKKVAEQVEMVAPTESVVCILGETGVGKELVARAIHNASPRHQGPFVKLNCAAVPGELIESELFGHEKGSFTGAISRHIGKFEAAQKGTLFLDEIGDMPAPMQAKLLRVLQEREFERIGSHQPITADVRVVAATHRDLRAMIARGQFREDLYHRIFVFPISVPPLRQRPEDIPLLAGHFAAEIAARNHWKAASLAPDALDRLRGLPWTGNVRELRNVIERALILARGGEITARLISEMLGGAPPAPAASSPSPAAGLTDRPLKETMDGLEREVVLAALERHGYSMTQTARALALERSHLYKKCQQLGIDLRAVKEGR
jgi:DNA-binding NtrC family response regulator